MLVLFLLVPLILHVAQKSLRSTGLYQILVLGKYLVIKKERKLPLFLRLEL